MIDRRRAAADKNPRASDRPRIEPVSSDSRSLARSARASPTIAAGARGVYVCKCSAEFVLSRIMHRTATGSRRPAELPTDKMDRWRCMTNNPVMRNAPSNAAVSARRSCESLERSSRQLHHCQLHSVANFPPRFSPAFRPLPTFRASLGTALPPGARADRSNLDCVGSVRRCESLRSPLPSVESIAANEPSRRQRRIPHLLGEKRVPLPLTVFSLN